MSCHWVKDIDGLMHYMPECIGGAVYGPDGCTCVVPESKIESKEMIIEKLLLRIDKYIVRINEIEHEILELREANMLLRNKLRSLSKKNAHCE